MTLSGNVSEHDLVVGETDTAHGTLGGVGFFRFDGEDVQADSASLWAFPESGSFGFSDTFVPFPFEDHFLSGCRCGEGAWRVW